MGAIIKGEQFATFLSALTATDQMPARERRRLEADLRRGHRNDRYVGRRPDCHHADGHRHAYRLPGSNPGDHLRQQLGPAGNCGTNT